MPNVNNAAIVPSSATPVVDRQGRMTTVLQRFFNALVSPAAPISTVTVGASPFTFRAGQAGTLVVTGGTVSAITLTRNATTVSYPTSGAFSMANGDSVVITYSGLPTVSFVPA